MRERATCALLALTAAYVTFGVFWRRAEQGLGEIAYDFYNLFYPNAVYALQSIAAGGHGLLWTPYQACGLPFLANTEVGLFYPGHVVFALFPREAALLASLLLHLAIAGAGTFLLCRELGLALPAALSGALAFQLGPYSVQLAGWGPIHLATYAWMPVAMWRTERFVRMPTRRTAVALALVLAVQLLAGFVQISYFTYGLVALRIAWALPAHARHRPLVYLRRAAIALLLPLGLAAVVLVPAREMVRASLRGRPLTPHDIGPGFGWRLLLETVWSQLTIPFFALVVCLAVLAATKLSRPHVRSMVLFWALVVAGSLVLSLGPGSGLWEVYARLPLAASFRGSGRLLWLANLGVAVLVAFGADAVGGALGRGAWLLVAAMMVNGVALGPVPYFAYRPGDIYDRSADAFAFVRTRLTAQDRVHVIGKPRDVALGPKSPSYFRLPGIYDYEAEAPLRYAEFFTYLRTGRPLERIGDWQWILDRALPPTVQRPLLDRTAARYLLVDRDVDELPRVLGTGIRLLAEIAGVRVYENEQALPRARWVPSAVTVRDEAALAALASAAYDPRRTVLLAPTAAPTPVGDARAAGSAAIARDDPEQVAIRVEAPGPGFLVLADTFYPGWTATVNGVPGEILRADYTFRAVAVPAGKSEVVFAYAPPTVWGGALVSVAALVLAAVLFRGG